MVSPADDDGTCYPPIADYALIGNCHTAALVGRDGAVDWYCPGRFDAPAVFCRLLDRRRGGYWQVAPRGACDARREYRGASNVLRSTFSTGHGQVRLTDFMPIYRRTASRRGHDVGTSHHVVRLVEGLSGAVDVEVRFKPTFDYARAPARISVAEGGAVAEGAGAYLTLACPGVALAPDEEGGVRAVCRIAAGQRLWLALARADDAAGARRALALPDCEAALDRTLAYWDEWAAAFTYQGPYREAVLRSVLALKLLTYEPSGAIVAAPTTSLPEQLGGVRNWDYRYTWLRDASLILYALMTVGYRAEARDFFEWLERACGEAPTRLPPIMYAVDARHVPPETTLDHLAGYCGARPVRIGNAAAGQRQLDVFGEVLMAARLHYQRPRGGDTAPDEDEGDRPGDIAATWSLLRGFVDLAAAHWQEPDCGIWEIRGGPRDFLYSKLMCWAAVDSGVRLAEEWGLDAPLRRWRETCDAIRQAILARGFDPYRGAFTQAFGSSALDASALIIPRIGFLPATDPRVDATINAIQTHLVRNGLVDRYHAPDGLPGDEASFGLCSFWLVDALSLSGRLDEAHELFERIVGCANDVGLLSEEIAPRQRLLLGNFPQGFTHLALVRAAVNLAKAEKHGPEEHAESEAQRAGPARRAAAERGAVAGGR